MVQPPTFLFAHTRANSQVKWRIIDDRNAAALFLSSPCFSCKEKEGFSHPFCKSVDTFPQLCERTCHFCHSATPCPFVPTASYFSLEKNNSWLQKINPDFLGNSSVRKAWTVTKPGITRAQFSFSLVCEFCHNFKRSKINPLQYVSFKALSRCTSTCKVTLGHVLSVGTR